MGNVIRVALCQDNLPVGDLMGNVARMHTRIDHSRECGADLVVFPELSIAGYPPEDLLLKPGFINDTAKALDELAVAANNIVAVVGYPERSTSDGNLYNSAAILANGHIVATYRKHHLPNYSVFDERRYFASGRDAVVVDLSGRRIGVTVCEDIWLPGGPAEWATTDGAALLINLSASPYHVQKGQERERLFANQCIEHQCFLAFCNAVGGQDELVFDGHSLVIGPGGDVIARGKPFEEDLIIVDLDLNIVADHRNGKSRWTSSAKHTHRIDNVLVKPTPVNASKVQLSAPLLPHLLSPDAEVYRALTIGTADYIQKNEFQGAVIGLSGGIDSALTLTITADAIGPDAVTAVSMPSRFTADMNRDDARQLATNLGVKLLELPIEALVSTYTDTLAEPFSGSEPNVAEENVQARIRGNLLMALSNKFGWLVLATGNKSELSVGYATLYGDMAGGFAVLKDVLKTEVYRLARWRNRNGEIIPQRIINKPPTAELSHNQLDTDSLPPYDELDGILKAYVERDESLSQIVAAGFNANTVSRVISLVDRAEYKRRQAPPGVRVSKRAFGKDRRLPITNRYQPRS